jgi:hypothetical protein
MESGGSETWSSMMESNDAADTDLPPRSYDSQVGTAFDRLDCMVKAFEAGYDTKKSSCYGR